MSERFEESQGRVVNDECLASTDLGRQRGEGVCRHRRGRDAYGSCDRDPNVTASELLPRDALGPLHRPHHWHREGKNALLNDLFIVDAHSHAI